ncbi:MAG: UDP-3-O-(3-hydroxymyristoyl)glucosamine N-acyltransferase [Planctomycetota bacterium]
MIPLADIAQHLEIARDGLPTLEVTGVNTLEDAGPSELSYLAEERYVAQAKSTKAGVLLVSASLADVEHSAGFAIVVDDAGHAADRVLDLFHTPPSAPAAGVHPSAVVDKSAELPDDVAIGAGCVVGARSRLGRGTVLHANVTVGSDVAIGEDCRLFPGVVLYDRVTLADRVVLHANVAIGCDGFGYRFDGQAHRKIAHVGTVVIEDDVEIGASTTVDRGKFAETRIGAGTKIDNLVQVAHNVRIGKACILCANVGVAGSTVLGNGVVLAGGAGVRDHVTLGDGVTVAAFSAVPNDVKAGETVVGAPAVPQRDFLREQGALRKLPDMMKQVRGVLKGFKK